ncbi:MAG TPA: signal peptidase II, partial [Candidatus Nanoarchaeia archaeon]|nr:signal peptidase II [Candidatus Nanoarchaeia archaeon]
FVTITLATIIIDQILKYLIVTFQPKLNLSILSITFTKNTGAGFGILQNQTLALTLISFAVACLLIYFYNDLPKEKLPQILFALFLGGTMGNLLDRIFRQYVIDFISFTFWPAFNIADASISIAAVGLAIYYLKNKDS